MRTALTLRRQWLLAGVLLACSCTGRVGFEARPHTADTDCGEFGALPCLPIGMVVIPAAGATFTMGSPTSEAGRRSNEMQHAVTFTRDFALAVTEVMQADFEQLMGGWNPSAFVPCPTCPVENISWYDALAYLNRLSAQHGDTPCYALSNVTCDDAFSVGLDYMACMNATRGGIRSATVTLNGVGSLYDCAGFRLPSEAEWEYAARAGTTTATYNGDLDDGHLLCEQPNSVLDPIAWFCGNAGGTPHPVGTAVGPGAANAWGLYDVIGNVWELTWDRYGAYPGSITDPEGPATGSDRASRGAGYRDPSLAGCRRAAYRGSSDPSNRFSDQGFRVAQSLR